MTVNAACPECCATPSRFIDGNHAPDCSRAPRCPSCGWMRRSAASYGARDLRKRNECV